VTKFQEVFKWQIVGNGKVVVVVQVLKHYDPVAFVTTKAVDKIAICADTGVLAGVVTALPTLAFALAIGHAAPLALAVTFALFAFALLALAVAVALECLTLVTAHQIAIGEKTTVRVVELTKVVQVHVIRHDVKSVPNRQQVENQDYNSITYFIIISKSIFKIPNYLKTLKK
jgi:hypothetical protein